LGGNPEPELSYMKKALICGISEKPKKPLRM